MKLYKGKIYKIIKTAPHNTSCVGCILKVTSGKIYSEIVNGDRSYHYNCKVIKTKTPCPRSAGGVCKIINEETVQLLSKIEKELYGLNKRKDI